MRSFIGDLVNHLSSRSLLYFAVSLWMLVILGSIFFLAPGPDDNFYVSEALGVVYFGEVGKLFFDDFYPSFSVSAGYSYLNGLFLEAWLGLGLPFNLFTYKIFHLLGSLLLILFSVILIEKVGLSGEREDHFPASIFLILLGVTPFTMDFLYPRPEAWGLFFLVLATLLYRYAYRTASAPSTTYLGLSGFLIGMAATHHPGTAVVGLVMGILVLINLLRCRYWLAAAASTVAAAVPVLILVAWFLSYAPESLDLLLAYVGDRRPAFGYSIVKMFGFALLQEGGTKVQKAYYAIMYLALLAIFIAVFMLLGRALVGKLGKQLLHHRNLPMLGFFLGGLVYLLQDGSGRAQLFMVVAFTNAIFVAFLLSAQPVFQGGESAKGKGVGTVLAYGIAAGAILFLPISHAAKHLLPGERFSGFTARNLLLKEIEPDDLVFVRPDNLASPLNEMVARHYATRGKDGQVFVPFQTQIPSRKHEERVARKWVCLISDRPEKAHIWGLASESSADMRPDGDGIVLKYRSYFREFSVRLRQTRDIYKLKDGLYMRGIVEEVRAIPLASRGGVGMEELLYPSPDVRSACDGAQ